MAIKIKVTYRYTLITFYGRSGDEGIPIERGIVVTGQMRSDHSDRVRRMANRNYGGNGGRALIMAALAAA